MFLSGEFAVDARSEGLGVKEEKYFWTYMLLYRIPSWRILVNRPMSPGPVLYMTDTTGAHADTARSQLLLQRAAKVRQHRTLISGTFTCLKHGPINRVCELQVGTGSAMPTYAGTSVHCTLIRKFHAVGWLHCQSHRVCELCEPAAPAIFMNGYSSNSCGVRYCAYHA